MKRYTHYQPKEKGQSDFYSWNLFRWLKNQDRERHPLIKKTKIYRDNESGFIYIGSRYDEEEKDVSGFLLRELCNTGSNKKFPMVFCYPQGYKWKDVTDWFWSEYERIGVCAIHEDSAHSFTYLIDNTARMCEYCGKIEKRKVEMVERITWETAI